MKNSIIFTKGGWIAGLCVLLLSLFGCTGNFDEVNRNPNEVSEDEIQRGNYKTGSNLRGLIGLVVPAQEHMYQFNELLVGGSYGGYAEGTPDGWKNKFSTYNPTADWLKWSFVNVIKDTYSYYRGIRNGTDNAVMLALADLTRVAIMHRVTDTYGPIPYSKIVDNKKEELTVGYDSQEAVYMKMFEELDAAIEALSKNTGLSTEAFGDFDGVYKGNVSQWIKYANSLKLRMALRLSYVKPEIAKSKAAEAIAAGVIESNADNAKLTLSENRATLPWTDWNDHRVGADIISYMNGYEDARRAGMFTKVKAQSGGDDIFAGMRIGIDPADKNTAIESYSTMNINAKSPYLWMNAAEVTFLRAEYELRWGTQEMAKLLYEQAIRLSFEEYAAAGADDYIASHKAPEAYRDNDKGTNSASTPASQIVPAWNDHEPESANTKEENLERIITQKWIAMFPLGNEAWAEYRRTGYPRLLPVIENKSGGTVDSKYGARRLNYPTEEYNENRANLQEAITLLGGPDTQGTRLWWDTKPLK